MRYPELLDELWRVLSCGGNLAIMDLALNITIIEALVRNMKDVLNCQPTEITDEDSKRSISLKQFTDKRALVRRIIIQKS